MDVEKKKIVEEIMSLDELLEAERTSLLRVNRIATWDTPEVEYAYQNADTLSTIAFYFPNLEQDAETWTKNTLDVLSVFDSAFSDILRTIVCPLPMVMGSMYS